MIDNITLKKLYLNSLPVEPAETLKNKLLVFPLSNVSTDGELLNRKQTAYYKNIAITIFPNKRVELRGSIHMFYNDGKHNANDFNVQDVKKTIEIVTENINFTGKDTELNGFEFGVNIEIPCNPKTFIDSLILHNGKTFKEMEIRGKGYGRECDHKNYTVKVYDKGLQYGMSANLLRFEIKVNKMQYCKDLGIPIKYLSDLFNVELYPQLGQLLQLCFDDILVYVLKTDISQLSKDDQIFILKHLVPGYWNTKPTGTAEAKRRQRGMIRFKELSESIGATGLKSELSDLIKWKCQQLIKVQNSPSYKDCPELTNFSNKGNNAKCPELTNFSKTDGKENSEPEKRGEMSEINLILKGQNRTIDKTKLCLSIGLDISMQKEGPKYKTETGLLYYHKNNPVIFEVLKKRTENSKYKNAPFKKQIYEIAKSI